MIELFRAADDPEADRIEEALREMVAGYHVVTCTRAEAVTVLGVDAALPVLRDGDEVAHGPEAIARFLDATERTLEAWRKFQTDACYLDDDGNVC